MVFDGMAWYGMAWYDASYDIVKCGMLCFWYCVAQYSIVLYGISWDNMVFDV